MTAAAEVMMHWDIMRGVGFLPIEAAPAEVYDADYFAKYVGYADTDQGRAITAARVEMVRRHAGDVSLCDVGIGCGSFVEAWPRAVGFDVNAVGIAWLKERGLYRDPWVEQFDALTFWDALEHIADPAPLLANASEWVFVSVPVVPGNGPPSPDWKHYRPTEHCWYWTHEGLICWMEEHGFRCVEHNEMESELGREDIGSFCFHRELRVSPGATPKIQGVGHG